MDAASSDQPAPPAPTPEAPRTGRPSNGRIAAVAGVAVVAAVAALGISSLLNDPVAENPTRDATPIVVGPVVPQGQELTGGTSSLPPIAMVAARPAPNGISNLPASEQVARLRELIANRPRPARFVELGSAYMSLGDRAAAVDAFTRARRLLPGDPAPLVGLAMTDAMGGSSGLDRAAGELAALRTRYPASQVVTFNQGWLAVYRRDVAGIRDAWGRTVALGAGTPLGLTAGALLEQVAKDARGGQGSTTTP